jgi:hypothetical protein
MLSGIEIMHIIRKGQMRDDGVAATAAEQSIPRCVSSTVDCGRIPSSLLRHGQGFD